MKKYQLSALALSLVLLTGCNTLTEKSYQKVRVETPGVSAADCRLETSKQHQRAITPSAVIIERSPYTMTVTCQKALYFDQVVKIEPTIGAWNSALNVVNGVIPGVTWDIASRSVYTYPDLISVEMVPDLAAMEAARDVVKDPVSTVGKKEPMPLPEPALSPEAEKLFDSVLRK